MTDPLLDAVTRDGLLAPGRRVVVLYSGGRDSSCLLDLAVRLGGAQAVTALHVNYGLRDRAQDDERHCREVCARLGVTLEVRRPRRPADGNLQAWARDLRYGEATRIATTQGATVAVGHTASDQAETILYRLAAAPSRRALLGMKPRDGLLIRPLLSFAREQTTAYCVARGLSWREDESNDTDAYARNRVRRRLVPALREVHPAAEQNLLASSAILRDEAAVLDQLVDETLAGGQAIELARLRALGPALARLVVQRLADDALGALAPGAGARAPQLAALSERGSVEHPLPHGLRARSEYGWLRIELRATAPAPPPAPVALSIPGRVEFGRGEVSCELVAPAREAGVLDRAALRAPLLVRAWRAGDRMAPLGLLGTKSLQDLFTARRVPRSRRGEIAVVESGGEIAWVAGVATSERFKVTDATQSAVRLRFATADHETQGRSPP